MVQRCICGPIWCHGELYQMIDVPVELSLTWYAVLPCCSFLWILLTTMYLPFLRAIAIVRSQPPNARQDLELLQHSWRWHLDSNWSPYLKIGCFSLHVDTIVGAHHPRMESVIALNLAPHIILLRLKSYLYKSIIVLTISFYRGKTVWCDASLGYSDLLTITWHHLLLWVLWLYSAASRCWRASQA